MVTEEDILSVEDIAVLASVDVYVIWREIGQGFLKGRDVDAVDDWLSSRENLRFGRKKRRSGQRRQRISKSRRRSMNFISDKDFE